MPVGDGRGRGGSITVSPAPPLRSPSSKANGFRWENTGPATGGVYGRASCWLSVSAARFCCGSATGSCGLGSGAARHCCAASGLGGAGGVKATLKPWTSATIAAPSSAATAKAAIARWRDGIFRSAKAMIHTPLSSPTRVRKKLATLVIKPRVSQNISLKTDIYLETLW